MKVGDIVRFRDPSADELGLEFEVMELRGDRVEVMEVRDVWCIPPRFVYLVDELELVKKQQEGA
jgi:hypothetical protein